MSSIPHPRELSVRKVTSATLITPFDAVGALGLSAALGASDGVWGLLIGLLVVGAALASAGPAAFAVAQLGIISLVPASDAWLLVTTQCAAFLLLASAAYGSFPSPRQVGRLAVVYVMSLCSVWALQANLRWLWHAALTIAVLVGTVAYALHRYERVAAGLVTAERES